MILGGRDVVVSQEIAREFFGKAPSEHNELLYEERMKHNGYKKDQYRKRLVPKQLEFMAKVSQ